MMPVVTTEHGNLYAVEKILDERKAPDGTTEYKIRWAGFESDEDNWEKEGNVISTELIEEFHKRVDRAKRRKSGTNPTSGIRSGSNTRKSSTTAERTSVRPARKAAHYSGSSPKTRGRPHKKTSNTADSSDDGAVPSKKCRRTGRLRTSESELSTMSVHTAMELQQLQTPFIRSPSREPSIEPKPRGHPRKPVMVAYARQRPLPPVAARRKPVKQELQTPASHPPSREPSAEPMPRRSSRKSNVPRVYTPMEQRQLQTSPIHSPSREPSDEPKPRGRPRRSDKTVQARLPVQQQLQTSSTHSPSREPSPDTNRRNRSRKSDRTVQPVATPTMQPVQQQLLQTPASHPPSREPSVESNVSTSNATAIGDIRQENRDDPPGEPVDVIYPTDNYRALELNCKTDLLKLNEPVMLVCKNFGCLPVEVYMNVRSESGEDKLAVIVKCNKGVRSNLWSADAKIDITLLSGPPIDTMCHTFRWGKSSCDIELPVTLAEVLQDESSYIDRRGVLTFMVKIQLDKVDGYMQPFCRNLFSQYHPLLTNATINVKGETFHVDSSLLCKSSPVFYEAFYGLNKKKKTSFLIVSDCTPGEFETFLTKMYFPTDRIKASNVIHLLRLAYRFDVGYIIENCLEFLKDKPTPLDVKIKAIELSDKLGDAELQHICVETIFKEDLLDRVVKSAVYENLSPKYKVLLLSRATKEQVEKVILID